MRLSDIINFFSKKRLDADIYIVSYPKSGRTWLRVMLCHYLSEKYQLGGSAGIDIMEATAAVDLPLTKFVHDQAYPSSGIVYSDLKFDHKRYSHRSVIFLGRDIKDTLVSAYHDATKRNVVFQGTISEFIRDQRFGVKKIVRFYQMWCENRSVPNRFLYVCYEDMHKEPAKTLRTVLNFMGECEISESALENAVRQGDFSNMRRIELSMKHGSSVLRAVNINDQDSFKTRKGIVGSFKTELSSEDIEYIDNIMGEAEGFSFDGEFVIAKGDN